MASAAKLGQFGRLLLPNSLKIPVQSSSANCLFSNYGLERHLSAAALPQQESSPGPTVTLIPGDGVGPEIAASVMSIFRQTGIPVQFEELFVSEVHPDRSAPVSKVVESMKNNNGIGLAGAIQVINSQAGELQSLTTKLRRALDLFANVVHIRSLEGVNMRHRHPLDFVIIREQTEGEYSALEHECIPGVVESLKLVTREKSLRIAKFAFDYATKRGRKSVTAVHKANIMKLGDGLFLRTCEEVSKLYPKIEFRNMIIDNCCMQLVSNPHQFDVMVMTNLYGNIVDNLGAGLVGGAGVVTGESYGADCVMFEPGARHTFQQAIGRDIANPTAMILSAAKMLRHMYMPNYADGLLQAVEAVIKEGKVRTRDLGGYATTGDFTDAIISKVRFD